MENSNMSITGTNDSNKKRKASPSQATDIQSPQRVVRTNATNLKRTIIGTQTYNAQYPTEESLQRANTDVVNLKTILNLESDKKYLKIESSKTDETEFPEKKEQLKKQIRDKAKLQKHLLEQLTADMKTKLNQLPKTLEKNIKERLLLGDVQSLISGIDKEYLEDNLTLHLYEPPADVANLRKILKLEEEKKDFKTEYLNTDETEFPEKKEQLKKQIRDKAKLQKHLLEQLTADMKTKLAQLPKTLEKNIKKRKIEMKMFLSHDVHELISATERGFPELDIDTWETYFRPNNTLMHNKLNNGEHLPSDSFENFLYYSRQDPQNNKNHVSFCLAGTPIQSRVMDHIKEISMTPFINYVENYINSYAQHFNPTLENLSPQALIHQYKSDNPNTHFHVSQVHDMVLSEAQTVYSTSYAHVYFKRFDLEKPDDLKDLHQITAHIIQFKLQKYYDNLI